MYVFGIQYAVYALSPVEPFGMVTDVPFVIICISATLHEVV